METIMLMHDGFVIAAFLLFCMSTRLGSIAGSLYEENRRHFKLALISSEITFAICVLCILLWSYGHEAISKCQ